MKTLYKFSNILSVAALTLGTATAFAADTHALTRQEVAAATRAAAAAGGLTPAGETASVVASSPGPSSATRREVRAEVTDAFAAGTMASAGELGVSAVRTTQVSVVTRAEVKAEVIEAEREGELTPAGIDPNGEALARNHAAALARIARQGQGATFAKR